ncbi:MAG TPA: antitoxin [Anaerolineae bacterium]|jgi:hypothetical protein
MIEVSPDNQDLYLDSAVLNLQSFYTGLERIFELVARGIDLHIPDGENWHLDLLRQMASDLPDVRPAIISQKSALRLDEYRRFRHLVRNIYTDNLRPERMAGLLVTLPDLWFTVKTELLAYADLLQQIEESDQ